MMGRINKELKEICLLDQVYIKAEDGKQTVGKYVEEVAKIVFIIFNHSLLSHFSKHSL